MVFFKMRVRYVAMAFALAIAWVLLPQFLSARDLPPVTPPPAPAAIPVPSVRTLANGLTVVEFENHGFPVVKLTLAIKTGAEADPPKLPGMAQFVASLLNEGTESRGAQQIAAVIDGMGAVFDSGADWDDSWATLSVLSGHTREGFDLLSDMVMHPAFGPAEIRRLREQTISALQVLRRDPAYLADTLIEREIFWGTPYSHPANGVEQSVRLFTRPDLLRFYGRYYRPSNAILMIAGDLSANRAFALAQRYFGAWRDRAGVAAAPEPSLPIDDAGAPPRRSVVVIDDPNAVQTEIRVANIAPPRASPVYGALAAANQVLGGPAENWLFTLLRTRRGLVYGASSELVCYRRAGAWEIKTSTRTASTGEAIRVILRQMKRMDARPIRHDELTNVQNYLIGKMALDFETSSQIAQQSLELTVRGLPLDTLSLKAERIRALNRNDVWTATRQYLCPANAVIVLVGNAPEFKNELNGLGPVRIIPLADVDLASATLETPQLSHRRTVAEGARTSGTAKERADHPRTMKGFSMTPPVAMSRALSNHLPFASFAASGMISDCVADLTSTFRE